MLKLPWFSSMHLRKLVTFSAQGPLCACWPVVLTWCAFWNSVEVGDASAGALLPPENATGNFTKVVQRVPVRVALDPADPLVGRLRPGLSVEATVHTADPVEPADPARGRPKRAPAALVSEALSR